MAEKLGHNEQLEYLIESARHLVCSVFECGRGDTIFFPLMTGAGGFYSRIICRSCYMRDMSYDSDSSIPIGPVDLDKRGMVSNNMVYPPEWYEIYAGKCRNCGKITFGLRRNPKIEDKLK